MTVVAVKLRWWMNSEGICALLVGREVRRGTPLYLATLPERATLVRSHGAMERYRIEDDIYGMTARTSDGEMKL